MTYHYGGYLYRVRDEILELHRQGMSPREIAYEIRSKVDTSAEMVRYVIKRYTQPQPANVIYPERRREEYLEIERGAILRHPDWFILLERVDHFGNCRIVRYDWSTKMPKGRPIDMGGPRDVWIEQSPWDEV